MGRCVNWLDPSIHFLSWMLSREMSRFRSCLHSQCVLRNPSTAVPASGVKLRQAIAVRQSQIALLTASFITPARRRIDRQTQRPVLIARERYRNIPVLCFRLSRCNSRHMLSPTRSSAVADGPRDALCQLKSCELLHNSRTPRIGRPKLYNKSTRARSNGVRKSRSTVVL